MLIWFFVLLLPSLSKSRDLKFVQAIWRHGDRAPTGLPYPNDPYKEDAWPRGWGQLTSIGMQQHHDLGKYFRQRYGSFISDSFVPSQAYMRSSDTDRALSSAQAFLSGLFPATGEYQWQAAETWQPIPVHGATAGEEDWLCKGTSVDCPAYDVIYDADEKRDSDYYTAQYADFFDMLRQSNTTGNTNFGYSDINGIYDINRELIHDLTALQPAWVYQIWPQYNNRTTLEIATELRIIRYFNQFGTQKKGQFFAGYLLNNFISHAHNVSAGTQKNPSRILWYSSHDTVVSSLMYTMGLGNHEPPPYAACFFMEVYSDSTTQFFYKNTTGEPFELTIPGCDRPCSVKNLATIYRDIAFTSVVDAQKNCGIVEKQCSQENPNAAGWLSILLPLILTVYWIF